MTDINKLIAELERLEGAWDAQEGGSWRRIGLLVSLRNHLPQILTALRQARAAEGLAEALRELLVPVKLVGETMWGPAGHRYPGYEATVPSASVKIAEAALKAYEEGKKEPAK